MVTTETKQTV